MIFPLHTDILKATSIKGWRLFFFALGTGFSGYISMKFPLFPYISLTIQENYDKTLFIAHILQKYYI
ncbi:hypothetical protein CBFG_00467 [Clostridiales bacterium 1_7_47FAA]|nr:hypothetical protein CBFG_00467 [Clostridiales bacterium 1_7_47FAA]